MMSHASWHSDPRGPGCRRTHNRWRAAASPKAVRRIRRGQRTVGDAASLGARRRRLMATLFDVDAPAGFQYRDGFITTGEEASLLEHIAHIQFGTFEMRGIVARRRVAFFGRAYDEGATSATPPIPEFLVPLRATLGRS